MIKSKLSKKDQKVVSKVCQECGRCCMGQITDWFVYHSTPADWRRWASDKKVFQRIQSLMEKSIVAARRHSVLVAEGHRPLILPYGEKEGLRRECGCLGRVTHKGNKVMYICLIEDELGYRHKPHTCRYYECRDKLKGVVEHEQGV